MTTTTDPATNSLWASRHGSSAVLRFVAPATYLQPELGSVTDLFVLQYIGEPEHVAVDANDFHSNYQQVK